MKLFLVRDGNEEDQLVIVLAKDSEDAVEKYKEWVDMPPEDWSPADESGISVEEFDLPTSERPAIQLA